MPLVDPYELPKAKYLVCGQINLDKSDVYQRDFLQYIHSLAVNYRLTAYGDIGPGMEIYGYLSRSKRQEQIFDIQKHTSKYKRLNKGNVQPYNVHTVKARTRRQRQMLNLARGSIPDEHIGLQPSIWNMDLGSQDSQEEN